MQQDWVLDVLADLRSFAQQNGMFALAEQLDDTLIVAAADLAAHRGREARVEHGPEARESDCQIAGGKQPR